VSQAAGFELSMFLGYSGPRDGRRLLRNIYNTYESTPCHSPENLTLYYISFIHSIIFHFFFTFVHVPYSFDSFVKVLRNFEFQAT